MARKVEVLKPKHKMFVDEYIKCGEKVESAKRAGYKGRNLSKTAHDLLQRPHIKAYYEEQLELAKERARQENIASLDDILEFYTEVMKDSRQKVVNRLKAADSLAKIHQFNQEQETDEENVNINITFNKTQE